MKDDQLINKQYHILQRNKINKDKDKFIYNEIEDIYFNNYSKNNKFISQIEIIYITGWKK